MKKLISCMLVFVMLLSMLPALATGTGLSYVLADQNTVSEVSYPMLEALENFASVLSGEKQYALNWQLNYNSSISGINTAEVQQGNLCLGRTEDGALQLAVTVDGQTQLLYSQNANGFVSPDAYLKGSMADLANVENLNAAQMRALLVAMFAEAENADAAAIFTAGLLNQMAEVETLAALIGGGEFTAVQLIDLVQSALQNLTLDMPVLNALADMPLLDRIGVEDSAKRIYIMKLFRRMDELLETVPNQNDTVIRLQQAGNGISLAILLNWAESSIVLVESEGQPAQLQLKLSEKLLSGVALEAALELTETEEATEFSGNAIIMDPAAGKLNAAIAGAVSEGAANIGVVALGNDALVDILFTAEASYAEGTMQATQIAVEPTAAPTAEPTAEPTPEPTAEPVALQINDPVQESVVVNATEAPTPEPAETQLPEAVIVPYGEAFSFDAQITADGNARLAADSAAYETVNFTLQVNGHKDPVYFRSRYSNNFNLTGTEAAVEFNLTLNNYEGAAAIIPQNIILVTMLAEDGTPVTGYQLMDAEIAGNTGIVIAADAPATFYKRYPFDANLPMQYLSVKAYVDGVEHTYLFELAAAPAAYETLSIGSVGAEVNTLQAKLIELGLLQGAPDGKYGNYTAGAVKEMQRRFGMAQTGIADPAFLAQLYS